MTDREKLIGLLYESDFTCNQSLCEECDYLCSNKCKASMMADHLLANGVTFQKWIPVSERLPEYDTDVLTFRGTAGFCIECYHTGGWGFDNIFMDDITHWMPLPDPPEKE